MDTPMKITGTFVQPLCGGDIPVMNWREEEWDKEFFLMKTIGIDTVILLRQALGKWLAYKSDTLIRVENAYEPSYDYMEMFLNLCRKHEMTFFVPTYTPAHDWLSASYVPEKEFEFLKPLVDEIWERYGGHKAFGGWYMAQEISRKEAFRVIELLQRIGPYCKQISGGLPVLMSPGMQGPKGLISTLYPPACRKKMAVTFDEHREEWDWMLGELRGCVDIIAFQDGHVEFDDLETFQKINVELCRKHGMECWSNIESFDRDIQNPKFPPIGWEKLRFKLLSAERAGHDKFITYEFTPFLSPNGCYPSAQYLYKRYCEHIGMDNRKN